MSNLTAQELDVMLKTLRGNIDQLFLIVMGILVFREYNLTFFQGRVLICIRTVKKKNASSAFRLG